MIEVEVKLQTDHTAEITTFFEKQGFVLTDELLERDSYFDSVSGEIRGSDRALRIREITDLKSGEKHAQMNHKGRKMDNQTMTREELEIEVSDAETGRKILRALGYEIVRPEVVKHRREYKKGDMTVCMDQVEGLGEFLELEIIVPEENDKKEALSRIETVLKQIGYRIEDTLTTSYLTMLQNL